MQECEIECIKNRWGRKLLQALECTEQKTFWTGEELSNIWTIPGTQFCYFLISDSVPNAHLKKYSELVKEAHKRIFSFTEQRKKALSEKLNWKPSTNVVNAPKGASKSIPRPAPITNEKQSQGANAKRNTRGETSNKENKSANDIDSIFSSPEYKKTRSKEVM